jgi:two-component system, chemotaxis family, sensor kinase CheA
MVLKEPAREEAAFRKKLDTIFRQVHSVKGEAAGLGLTSIEGRAHSFEDDLRSLREKPALSGSEFLPLVLKLDDLFTHLQSVRDLVARLSRLRVSADVPEAPEMGEGTDVIDVSQSVHGLHGTITQVAQRVASSLSKEIHVECVGLAVLPSEYRRMVKDIAVQAVRNSLVHGIESPQLRLGAGKPAQGTIHIEVQDLGSAGYKLTLEDDGQGLSTDRIKQVAVHKGFVSQEQADAMDSRQVLGLLFRAGFTTVDVATKDAGRGVGMNLMADLVQQSGGKLGVATAPGKFTRFTIMLPAVGRADVTEVA